MTEVGKTFIDLANQTSRITEHFIVRMEGRLIDPANHGRTITDHSMNF